MRSAAILVVCLAAPWAAGACGKDHNREVAAIDRTELERRAARLQQALADPDSESAHAGALARWLLPDRLKELAGLALTADGRLLTHGVKRGRVFEIDYRRGVLVKQFSLGRGRDALEGSFAGITVVNDVVYLLAHDGKLYEFREGKDGAKVDYLMHDTGLGGACEFGGVAFARAINSLLLACHRMPEKSGNDSLVIFRWRLAGDSSSRSSRLTVPMAAVIGPNPWKTVRPTDITVDPFQGNYVIIAAKEQALIQLTPEGAVVASRPLPGKHAQASGVAITRDSILIISDEAGHRTPDEAVHRPAVVTLYRWQ